MYFNGVDNLAKLFKASLLEDFENFFLKYYASIFRFARHGDEHN
jgi:hypothetical protein